MCGIIKANDFYKEGILNWKKDDIIISEIDFEKTDFKFSGSSLECIKIFSCPVWECIPLESVGKIVFFTVSIEDLITDDPIEKLNFDLSAMELIEKGKELLIESVKGDFKYFYFFGPGYYGMPVLAAKDILSLFPEKENVVSLNKWGVMSPANSICGMIFLSNYEFEIDNSCMYCGGKPIGCQLCKKKER